MRIPQSFLDEVKYRNKIEDVVASYVNLKRAGSVYQGLCPFHSEKTPSFTVFPNTETFHCFGCGAGGDIISFIMRAENLEYLGAVEFLAKRAGLEMPDAAGDAKSETIKRARLYEMNRAAAVFFNRALYAPESEAAREYLKKRGLSRAAVKRFGLGYAPNRFDALSEYMHSLGYRDEELKEAFLCGKSERTGGYYDYFRGRIMFPIIDNFSNVIAFGGRALGDEKPKYLNTSDTPVFKKSRNLFALNFARNACAQSLILCEGYMDVIAVNMAGFPNAVATLGTALTAEQARVMAKYTKKVILSYDSDEAGVAAAKRAIPILTDVGLEVKMLRMEGAKDPDEYIKKFGAARFKILLDDSQGKIDYLCDSVLGKYDILIPEEKLKAANELCEVIGRIDSDVEREIYITRIAERLSVEPAHLARDVERRRRRNKKASETEMFRKVVSDTLGYGDRINRDFVGNAKAARAEEAIIGILLLRPELILEIRKGTVALCADDFVTAFNRRVFEALTACEDKCDIGALAQDFTVEEIDRITAMQVKRSLLTKNDLAVLQENVQTLKSAADDKQAADEIEDIKNLLSKKKK
ncbi:MAG: DNA primase [Clostridiales bacterium]|nr:MAG: DNA primase [Clostridiales bacterium]